MTAHPRPYYYLENFTVALDWLRGRYKELLAADEQQFMDDFSRLPVASAALVVRMIMRKGDLFRTSKLNYAEIGCPRQAAAPPIELGWLDPRPDLNFPNLCRLLRKPELWSILGLRGPTRTLRKSELTDFVGPMAQETRPLDGWWPGAPDEIFQVKIVPLCNRLRLMFFGNFRQTWSEFVLADLGIFRYEKIPLDEAARAFQTRQQVDQFHAIYHCREMLHAEAPLEDVLSAVPPPLADNTGTNASHGTWIEAKRAKLLFAIGQLYEQAHDLPQALEVYKTSQHPEARLRTIRVLEKLERFTAAAELLAQVRQAPASEWEAQLSARILPRLNRKLGIPTSQPSQRARRDRQPSWETLELELPHPSLHRPTNAREHSDPDQPDPSRQPAPLQRVEFAVSAHLTTPEAPTLYVENTLINTLFGLLCWRAIFAPLPGAFFHEFHPGPADLLEPDFHRRREPLFSACLGQLNTGAYRDTILQTFDEKSGIQSPFVPWGALTREELELALQCIPATHLQKFFERLLTDIRANRSGLPDLVQLWPTERRYRLIEVKGPGDRLQDNQVRWLSFCRTHDIPVCVCKVRWQGVAT